jgi:hypothetical protein
MPKSVRVEGSGTASGTDCEGETVNPPLALAPKGAEPAVNVMAIYEDEKGSSAII